MPITTINGHSIFYLEFGNTDRPLLLLVHGLYGDSSSLVPLANRLAEHFRVVVPDALGHGRSARPAEFTLADQGRMLNGLAAALGNGPAALLGISMGSYLAAEAAILEPDRTAHLVLVVPKAHGTTSSSAAYAERLGFDLAAATQAEAIVFLADALWSPDTPPARREELIAVGADQVELTADERAAIERSLAGFDLRPALSSITAATLVLSGRSDGLNPPEAGAEVARLITNSRFEIYEHSGHMLAAEEMDRLVADVTAFVLG